MKRTCGGCKALKENQYNSVCLLDYKRKSIRKYIVISGVKDSHIFEYPAEQCPKPKTYSEFIKVWRSRK